MKPFDKKLQDLVQRGHLNLEQAARMIVKHHMLEKHYKKKELVEMKVDLEPKALSILQETAKKLKISVDAVFAVLASDYLDEVKK